MTAAPPPVEVSIREARANLAELINLALYQHQVTYLLRHGRRVAAIVPAETAQPQAPATATPTRADEQPPGPPPHGR
jgi:prevent-host-death family protein